MTAVMCEKSYPTKPVEPVLLPVQPPSPLLRSKYEIRTSRQIIPKTKPDSNLKKPVSTKRSSLSNSHGNSKTNSMTTTPRFEVKTNLTSTTGRPRKVLTANFPSTVETLPLRNKVTLMKSSLSRSNLYKSDNPSAWSRQMHNKYSSTVSKPPATTPRVYVDNFNTPRDVVDRRNGGFEDIVTKTNDSNSDYRAPNCNMGYREKCLQWLLTLPD